VPHERAGLDRHRPRAGGAVVSTKESANGWPTCMVLSHIDDTTRAVTRRRRRHAERRAWASLALILAGLAAAIAWGAMQ